MKNLSVVHTLGGCGGTLLGQCLGSFSSVCLLSESNPRSVSLFKGNFNPALQASRWHGLLSNDQARSFCLEDLQTNEGFAEAIGVIRQKVREAGKDLVLRDYNYVEFIGYPFVEEAAGDFSLVHSLGGRFVLHRIALVRHPLYQYASLVRHRRLLDLTADQFLRGCARFLDLLEDTPIFRYEDLVCDPEAVVSDISSSLHLRYDEGFMSRFSTYRNVTGDLSRFGESVIQARDRPIPDTIASDLNRNPYYPQLLARLGYDTNGRNDSADLRE